MEGLRTLGGEGEYPRLAETFWFEAGRGAWRDGEPLRAADSGPLVQEHTVGIGSEAIFVLDYGRFTCRQRNLGSLAAHWCYAASGALRANISVRDRLHDLGAAFGLALEAGCEVEYLDGGPVQVVSPAWDLTGSAASWLTFQYWFQDVSVLDDALGLEVSVDGGPWTPAWSTTRGEAAWRTVRFALHDVAALTGPVRVRFVASDEPNNSITEALIDEVTVTRADVAAVVVGLLDNPASVGAVLELVGGDTPVAEAVGARL